MQIYRKCKLRITFDNHIFLSFEENKKKVAFKKGNYLHLILIFNT